MSQQLNDKMFTSREPFDVQLATTMKTSDKSSSHLSIFAVAAPSCLTDFFNLVVASPPYDTMCPVWFLNAYYNNNFWKMDVNAKSKELLPFFGKNYKTSTWVW